MDHETYSKVDAKAFHRVALFVDNLRILTCNSHDMALALGRVKISRERTCLACSPRNYTLPVSDSEGARLASSVSFTWSDAV
jgi:hypothetical protein